MAVPRTFQGLAELQCGCVVEIVQSSGGQVVPLHPPVNANVIDSKGGV